MDTDTTTPLGPAGSDTGRWATPAPAAMPAAPPTYVDSPPLWGPPGASIPPVAGPPSWSTGPAGTPPAPPSVAPGPLPSRGGGGGTGRAVRSALVAFAVFAAGAGGVAVGANLVDDTGGSARLAPAGTGETVDPRGGGAGRPGHHLVHRPALRARGHFPPGLRGPALERA